MNRRSFIKLAGLSCVSINEMPQSFKGSISQQIFCCEIDNLNIKNLRPGELGVILGTSSSGKTTLLTKIIEEAYQTCGGNYFYFESDGFASFKIQSIPSSNLIHDSNVCDFETLLDNMRKCSKKASLIICDSLGDYPIDDKSYKQSNSTFDLKKLAIDYNVPVIVSIRTNKNPTCNDYAINEYSSYDWLQPVDEAVICRKSKNNHLPSIETDVLKSRRYHS